jgi:peptidoglycan/xylan/chitin deacetylase (PgdA/CDA1 family)
MVNTQIRTVKMIIKSFIPRWLIAYSLKASASNKILLTFDDGPDKTITPVILDLLEQFKARAVFFVKGHKVKENPDLLKSIFQKGHIIGNHTFKHQIEGQSTFNVSKQDLIDCQEIIKTVTGKVPYLFRPVEGKISFMEQIAAKKLGLKTVLWSNEGGEWGVNKAFSSKLIGNKLRQSLKVRDIVLLHDDNPKVPEILEIILPGLARSGMDIYDGINYL